ncbi:MAG: hypothetical protein CTY15_10020 [Methylocystis sp.]|nr:MAG: hypothetical protein CTY15_10020 [Methylocystis sp.]
MMATFCARAGIKLQALPYNPARRLASHERDCATGREFDKAAQSADIRCGPGAAGIAKKAINNSGFPPKGAIAAEAAYDITVPDNDVSKPGVCTAATAAPVSMSAELANVALATPGVLGSFFLGPEGRVTYRYVSPRSELVFGIEAQAICADAGVFFKRLHPGDLDALNARLFESARAMTPYIVEFRFNHPDKGLIWLEAQAAPLADAATGILWYGYASDITARKRSELALAETAAQLQATIDGAQDAILTTDAMGRIKSVNRAGAAMFGYEADAMIGLTIDSLVDSAGLPVFAGATATAGSSGEDGEDARGIRRDKVSFPVEITLTEAKLDHIRLNVVFIKNLSRQRMMESRVEDLLRNRLDAMGAMTATLAHEVNQPLAATATYLKVARRMLEKVLQSNHQDVLDVLDKAAAQIMRAGRIVTSFRGLVQREEPDKTLISMHALIAEVYDAFRREEIASGVYLGFAYRASRDQVIADGGQLRRVLANIIRNALEAMRNTEIRELLISTSNPDDETIRVDVSDTGRGIGVLEDKCFEPFTTTKEKGMGMGLSMSRSIIEAHYGRIWAKPNANGGTAFSFTLPLNDLGVEQ